MNFIHTETYTVTSLHTDCFDRIKLSCLLRMAQDAATAHCVRLGTDWDTMASKGYFWAVSRQRIEVSRLPVTGETITVKTWPMPTTNVAYPRATAGYDADGNELFRLISLWVIVNIQSRTMVLPRRSGVGVEGTIFGNELPVPTGLSNRDLPNTRLHTVGFTELDINGHVNNTRYVDWLYDLLPAEFHKSHPVKAATICYHNEAKEGQQIRLEWEQADVLQVDGSVPKTDASDGYTRIFSAQMEF